jgi:DNA-binding NarL/FixJ family response regulator
MAIRILIVDDHEVVRQGLRMFLETDPEMEIVGEADNGERAVALAELLAPDVILTDMLMPVMGGIEAIGLLRARLPETEIVAMTSVLEEATVIGAVRAGAIGYLLKTTAADALCQAIHAAAAGQVQLAPEAAALLMREVRQPGAAPSQGVDALTERETEVLKLLAQGQANKEIAVSLGIGDKTVKTHVSNVLAKLGVQSRTQAALQAARAGLVDPSGVGSRPLR